MIHSSLGEGGLGGSKLSYLNEIVVLGLRTSHKRLINSGLFGTGRT
jgi:hypothetical protein